MSKASFKIITAAITIVHLGGNESVWGMGQEYVNNIKEKEVAIIKARHQYHLSNSNKHLMDSSIDEPQGLLASGSKGTTDLQDITSCAACKNNVELLSDYKEQVLQDLLFTFQEKLQEINKPTKRLEDACKLIQKQLQREREEIQSRAAEHPLGIQPEDEEAEQAAAKALANKPKDEEKDALAYTWKSGYGLLGVIPYVTSRKKDNTKN